MIILRQPPFPIEVSYSGLDPDTNYLMEIYDDKSALIESIDVISSGTGVVEESLPVFFSRFDDTYSLYIYSLLAGEPDLPVVIDTLTIQRPYVDPNSLTDDPTLLEEYTKNERIARAIIDSYIGFGFYYKNSTIETTGLGADYLPMPDRINRINYVYRNNIKVYDRFAPEGTDQDTYVITPDYTAITIYKAEEYDRSQYKPVTLPLASSDSYNLYNDNDDPVAALTRVRNMEMFPKDFDYVVTGEFGWPVVPQDIQYAAKMLVDDLQCNRINYISKYITEYRTDQFTIKYDQMALKGTGNLVVDKILDNYRMNFYRVGVL